MRKKEKWVGPRHWYNALDVVRYGHILMQHNAAARVQQIKRLHGVVHGCKVFQQNMAQVTILVMGKTLQHQEVRDV
jgi:hypothetical protein